MEYIATELHRRTQQDLMRHASVTETAERPIRRYTLRPNAKVKDFQTGLAHGGLEGIWKGQITIFSKPASRCGFLCANDRMPPVANEASPGHLAGRATVVMTEEPQKPFDCRKDCFGDRGRQVGPTRLRRWYCHAGETRTMNNHPRQRSSATVYSHFLNGRCALVALRDW